MDHCAYFYQGNLETQDFGFAGRLGDWGRRRSSSELDFLVNVELIRIFFRSGSSQKPFRSVSLYSLPYRYRILSTIKS